MWAISLADVKRGVFQRDVPGVVKAGNQPQRPLVREDGHNYFDCLQVSPTYLFPLGAPCDPLAFVLPAPNAMTMQTTQMTMTAIIIPTVIAKPLLLSSSVEDGVPDSQRTPVTEGGHVQLNPVVVFKHVAPCWHSWSKQENWRSQN